MDIPVALHKAASHIQAHITLCNFLQGRRSLATHRAVHRRSLEGPGEQRSPLTQAPHSATTLFPDRGAIVSLQGCGPHSGNLHHQE